MKRNTIQKKLIAQAVNSIKTHPTAEEVYSHIALEHPTISRGTVYRNLGSMCDEGEIARVRTPGQPDRFDFNNMPHYHMVCTVCGRVFDVKMADEPCFDTEKCDDFVIEGFHLNFVGICKDCKK